MTKVVVDYIAQECTCVYRCNVYNYITLRTFGRLSLHHCLAMSLYCLAVCYLPEQLFYLSATF